MKQFILSAGFCFLAGAVYAHGEIESIKCSNEKESITLTGKDGKHNNLVFSLKEKGKSLLPEGHRSSLALKDVVENKQVVEEIRIPLSQEIEAVLLIPEDYEKEVREGRGSLAFKKDGRKTDLNCTVVY